MESQLRDRINRLETLVAADSKSSIVSLEEKVQKVLLRVPELGKLVRLMETLPVPSHTVEYDVQLVLANYEKFTKLVDTVVSVQAIDINKLQVADVDTSAILAYKESVVDLTEQYMRSVVKSLVVLEKYIGFMNEQNQFFMPVNDKLVALGREVASKSRDKY